MAYRYLTAEQPDVIHVSGPWSANFHNEAVAGASYHPKAANHNKQMAPTMPLGSLGGDSSRLPSQGEVEVQQQAMATRMASEATEMEMQIHTICFAGRAISVEYTRDDRLGSVDHGSIAEAVRRLPIVFDKAVGRLNSLIWVWLIPMAVGFVLGILFVPQMVSSHGKKGFLSLGIGVVLMFGGAGGWEFTRRTIATMGLTAVERELGSMNHRMGPLNFTTRTEARWQDPGAHSEESGAWVNQYFLIVRNLALAQPSAAANATSEPLVVPAIVTVMGKVAESAPVAGNQVAERPG